MAKRVLILAYDFLPSAAPGAALRTSKFAAYLPEFGWQPTIAARREPGATEKEADHVMRIAAPTVDLSYQITAWLWAAVARWRLLKEARLIDFQLIYVSCPPFPLGLVGASLAQRFSLPLVVDFRDAWSMDPYRPGNRFKAALKSGLCRWLWPALERKVLEAADCLLVATDSARDAYQAILPRSTHGPLVLPNGFDENDFPPPGCQPDQAGGRMQKPYLDLLYCGRFSGVGSRSPEWVFRALQALNEEGLAARLTILGDDTKAVRRMVRATGTGSIVTMQPMVDHPCAIRAMRNCDALLVYQEHSVNALSAVAGKTYEYIRTGKPILAVAPPGDNIELIRRYAGHAVLCTEKDHEQLLQALRQLHSEWRDRSLPPHSLAKDDYLRTFARRTLTAELAGIFDRTLEAHRQFHGQA